MRVDGETRLRVPIRTLEGIVCFGQVSCSPFLMALCGEHGVGLSFLSEHGRFLARVQGPVSGNVLLRREQYRCADDRPDGRDCESRGHGEGCELPDSFAAGGAGKKGCGRNGDIRLGRTAVEADQ